MLKKLPAVTSDLCVHTGAQQLERLTVCRVRVLSGSVRLGSILVAAAGNQAEDAVLYFPGNCEGVVSVGASTVIGSLAPYSNWNATLYAPGGDLSAPIAVECGN